MKEFFLILGFLICYNCALVLETNLYYDDLHKTSQEKMSPNDFHIMDCCYRLYLDSRHIIEEIIFEYIKTKKKKCFSNCGEKPLKAFVIYKSLKSMHIPRSIEQVASACGVTTNDIWNCERSDDCLSITTDVKDILKSIYSQANITFKDCNKLCSIADSFRARSFSPYTLCGALVYLFCMEKKKRITLKKIADILNVSNVSIHRCIKYLRGDKNLIRTLTKICS